MQIEWELPARMFIEQLSKRAQDTLAHDVQSLAEEWDWKSNRLKLVGKGRSGSVYSFRVGTDLRVILTRRGNTLVILDLVRNSQINKLRDILPKQY
jgi:hypothetical protein